MENDLDGLDVGCEDDEFTNTSVEGFGGFVGSVCQPSRDEPRSGEAR